MKNFLMAGAVSLLTMTADAQFKKDAPLKKIEEDKIITCPTGDTSFTFNLSDVLNTHIYLQPGDKFQVIGESHSANVNYGPSLGKLDPVMGSKQQQHQAYAKHLGFPTAATLVILTDENKEPVKDVNGRYYDPTSVERAMKKVQTVKEESGGILTIGSNEKRDYRHDNTGTQTLYIRFLPKAAPTL